MESLHELYRIGKGPSSSHTMGPKKAAELFSSRTQKANSYIVELFGSLAATGEGHQTEEAIREGLNHDNVKVYFNRGENLPLHPNGMRFEAFDNEGDLISSQVVYSIGGGAIRDETGGPEPETVYPLHTMEEILVYCSKKGITLWEYVEECEGKEIWDFLREVWLAMQAAIDHGLDQEGVLPGGLGVARKASSYQLKTKLNSGPGEFQKSILPAYALAVAEENASGETIVTSPTGGSSGVVPAVIRYLSETQKSPEKAILRALATAGLIGNLVKYNASISGAEVGCQGEIGTACSMAAAAATQMMGGSIRQIEYAAEMGLEHHLGLTCDPVAGLVQIPCIERNVFGASRAIDCANYAVFSDGTHRISFDDVVRVMKETGHDLPPLYRETSTGGLASIYKSNLEDPRNLNQSN
ncbi:MAG: L-serine ammonia-lyase [Anaerolineales bacterium]|nr:L-serine ammonia-lyase [Anaerolineales bacterium]